MARRRRYIHWARIRPLGLAIAVPALLALIPPAAAQLPSPPPPLTSPIPGMRPPQLPSVSLPAVPAAPATQGNLPQTPFAITSVVVEGATVYSAADLAPLTAGLAGTTVTLDRVDAVRQSILSRYRNDGYLLTAVSAVLAADGALHLRVTEGRIAEVKLDGDIGPAGTQVLRFLNRLTEPRVIDAATLERYLLLAQDVPGVTLRAVLRASTEEPGALTLVAQVSRKPVGGLLTADNRAFKDSGPEQGLGVLDLNSFTEFGEHTQLELYRSFNGTQIFGQGSVDVFLGSDGLRLRLYGGRGDSTPSGPFRAIQYIGRTTLFGAELAYPLIRSREQTLNLLGVFDASEATVEEEGVRTSDDQLRILRVGADYATSDLWLGDDRPAVSGITVRLSHGLSALGAGTDNASRPGARLDFVKADVDVTRTQTIAQPWDGASLALMGILSGQATPDTVPASEEFFLGGNRLARGFYFGQVSGDNALAGTAELQLNVVSDFFAPLLTRAGLAPDLAAQFYGFYDWGETWDTPAATPGQRLASTGIGVRLMVTRSTEMDLEGLRRLTRYPNGNAAGITALNATALYWRLLARF